MGCIHITDIEAAINWWRSKRPAGPDHALCPELKVLAEAYALMVFAGADHVDEGALSEDAYFAWLAWYDTTPDAPCIAICSTSQGDEMCKGCGRTFSEVQHWTGMTPGEKRETWRRIELEGVAWRFNRYRERALF